MPAQRTSLDVSLLPEPSAFIAVEPSSGRHRTAGGVVRVASRPFQEAERAKPGPTGAAPPRAVARTRGAGA